MSTLTRRLASLTDRQMYLLDMLEFSSPETIIDDCGGNAESIRAELEEIKDTLKVRSVLEAIRKYVLWIEGAIK